MKAAPRAKAPAQARRRPRVPPELSPRVARRERRRERSREEIVLAARGVLLRDGIAATTLDAVAREVGLTKAALYYYFPSKDAVLFEVMYTTFAALSQAIHDAVEQAADGAAALRAIIRETVRFFAPRLDDFRLMYMHAQVTGTAVAVAPEQLARLRPLNDLAYARAARLLADEWKLARGRAQVQPRMIAFLANLAAVGVLTMKGMVEHVGDPLRYTDDELVEALARTFEAAVRP